MTGKTRDRPSSKDEMDVLALIERRAKAVREGNMTGIRADHEMEILMFDVPPSLFSRGLDHYMATWKEFMSWSEVPVAFDVHHVKITAGKDVALAIGRYANGDPSGTREELQSRLTMGFLKVDGSWRVTREHHSLPAD